MHRLLVVAIVMALTVTSADARRRKHRVYMDEQYVHVIPPAAAMAGRVPEAARLRSAVSPPDADEPGQRGYARVEDLVPPDWQAQPTDADAKAKRFVSPDGSARFDAHSSAANREALSAQMKAIAFSDGEELTYIRGERTWIAAAGFRGEHIFYRKAVLACAGDRWHHVAFEYPAALKRKMDPYVRRAAEAVQHSQNLGCDTPVSAR
jgi:hypothetical protein